MKTFILPFCLKTRRWQVVRRKDNSWGFPLTSLELNTKKIGLVKPFGYNCGLFHTDSEIANQHYQGWAWYSIGALKDKSLDAVLDLLYPQLNNIVHSGYPIETIARYSPPATTPPLLFSQRIMYSKMQQYEIWYKGNCISSALVDPSNEMLYNVKVITAWRHRGIAKELMKFVLTSDTPPTKLIARPSLTDRGLELDDLISFYGKFNFKLTDRRNNLMERV
jgi:hypothetical protein